jgi:hypothetical protein
LLALGPLDFCESKDYPNADNEQRNHA